MVLVRKEEEEEALQVLETLTIVSLSLSNLIKDRNLNLRLGSHALHYHLEIQVVFLSLLVHET